MTPFTTVTGPALPLLRENIDTDVIIRIERLAALRRDELGPYAFESLRLRADGTPDPDCVLNDPTLRGAPILLAGANFGCGSSREGAVWALSGMGVRCVVAPSFGDIFFGNCFQNGLLPIRLPSAEVERLAAESAGGAPVTVDLQACSITTAAGGTRRFEVDALRRDGLLQGLDDIGLTLRDDARIRAWQDEDRARRPWAWRTEPNATGAS